VAELEPLIVAIDGGLGELAIAAIAATPAGPARDLEAVKWARRAVDGSGDHVLTVITPGMSDDEIDAHAAFMVALERERRAA
jgi:hypothetical protein